MTRLSTVGEARAAALAAAEAEGGADEGFLARFEAQFERLHGLFARLYGDRSDGQEALAQVIALASYSWRTRPADLKAHDARQRAEAGWFESQRMLGGVCYVDRYAGTLAGIRDQIPYFRELGLTYLHLMPLFASP